MQMDVLSPHAQRFMEILRPLLPVTPAADILRTWDCRYDPRRSAPRSSSASIAARPRRLRRRLRRRSHAPHRRRDGILADFYYNLDRILLAQQSVWFGGESREQIFARVLARSLDGPLTTWGSEQRVMMKHLMLGGRFPVWLGFDRGPSCCRAIAPPSIKARSTARVDESRASRHRIAW